MDFYLVQTLSSAECGRIQQRISELVIRTAAENSRTDHVEKIPSAAAFFQAAVQGKFRNAVLLFFADTDRGGINPQTFELLRFLQLHAEENLLSGARAGMIIDGQSDLYTKDLARRLAFAANRCGCMLPGKPLVEMSPDFHNFTVLAKLWQTDKLSACYRCCVELTEKLLDFSAPALRAPRILAVHAGNQKTSNSLSLWQMIANGLPENAETEEISVRNGQLWDCRGCKYEDCLHFGEQGDCFYGGVMTEKVYPAIIRSDVVVLICPNYNDSVSANMMAFINRLTSVFRVHDFSAKRIYAVIVSGYSGGDLVAQQIIGAMCMNKNMILPPHFAILETANAPGDILKIPAIKEKAAKFASGIF